MATTPTSVSRAAERRRKIVERGSDRLALITGRIQNLQPSSPSSPLDQHDFFAPDQITPRSYLSHQSNASDSSTYHRRQASLEAPKGSNTFDVGGSIDPNRVLYKSESARETITAPSFQAKPEIQKISKGPTQKPIRNEAARLFSSRRLNYCIVASERIRSICAFVIALLVVLSFMLGLNMVHSGSGIFSRPLYILVLTDITIVLARIYADKQGDFEEAEEEKAVQNDADNWTGAVKLMERGLVLYQTIRALFIDFSIYSVVVVSALSFF